MAMSLMHRWHDTICGGVIGPRRSLLYGAYGCILGFLSYFDIIASFRILILTQIVFIVSSVDFSNGGNGGKGYGDDKQATIKGRVFDSTTNHAASALRTVSGNSLSVRP
ncbi:hypothetical protein Tco_1436897 [Tanacetum coccineum]